MSLGTLAPPAAQIATGHVGFCTTEHKSLRKSPPPATSFGDGSPRGAFVAPDCGSRSSRWYCLQAHWRGEHAAIQHLANQGFATCWPRFQTGDDAFEPLFPGYLFVQFDRHQDRWRPICSSFMATRVRRGSAP